MINSANNLVNKHYSTCISKDSTEKLCDYSNATAIIQKIFGFLLQLFTLKITNIGL